MKNKVEILSNLKNRTVLTYISIVILTPFITSNLIEYESLKNILETAIQIVAILGIIDDPNTNYFLKK